MTTTNNMTKDPVKESMLTAEVYKKDKRIKARSKSVRWGLNKLGLRFIKCFDFENMSEDEIRNQLNEEWCPKKGYEILIHKTYVVRKNMMSGKLYYERYNTPYYCSPSSESYWSM